MRLRAIIWSLCSLGFASASVTVWSQVALGHPTGSASAAAANYTGAAAYDPTVLTAPAIPNPAPPNTFFLQLLSSNTSQGGLSIMQKGSFFGFSIEMSVVNQVLGINSSFIQVPFLNLMANIKQRAGGVTIRVGGNTQETASLVQSLPDDKAITKDKGAATNPTQTPATIFTSEIIYMLSNISSLVGVKWYLGVGMNDTNNLRLQIAEVGEAILGGNLLGLQVGNEPDLYGRHGLGGRQASYSPFDYFGEFGVVMNAINNNPNIPVKNNIIGPSVSGSAWSAEDVYNTGYIAAYNSNLMAISVEHYPDDNCFAQFGGAGSPKIVQDEFPKYLDHTAGQKLVMPFANASAVAQAAGKPFLMMETNTASCGGFPGISDSFGAALWGLDYGLQMAYHNFSGALLHVGGQNVYYNPFTPPPTNQSTFHQWTIGPIYFAPLIIAEAFGSSNTAQVIDLNANAGNIYTPAYAIYEQGTIARVALFNYVTDTSGGSTYTASIAIGGGNTGQPGGTPTSVKIKYLAASSVSQKENITWAGQGFGSNFESDGRLQGDLSVQTINCADNVCQVQVPAPGFALVFLTDDALSESTPKGPQTFATTAVTKTMNTATVDPSVLATSNGHNGSNRQKLASTSRQLQSGSTEDFEPSTMVSLALMLGAVLVGRQLAW